MRDVDVAAETRCVSDDLIGMLKRVRRARPAPGTSDAIREGSKDSKIEDWDKVKLLWNNGRLGAERKWSGAGLYL
jgi:hypothetical protein